MVWGLECIPGQKIENFVVHIILTKIFYQNITILSYTFFSCQVVSDGDISKNAEYELELENIENSEGVFEVHPTKAVGRTPVIIRVVNPDRYVFNINDKFWSLAFSKTTLLHTFAQGSSLLFTGTIFQISIIIRL